MDGILNIIKPSGMTSHDVVSAVRRITGIRRTGHAGTLDPLAAGVLPVYIGKATRLIEYCDEGGKIYHAQFLLGYGTDTEDGTGEIIERKETPVLSVEAVEQTLQKLTGTMLQRPSKYSAVKIQGKKAYELARANVEFEIPPRKVEIYRNELLAFDGTCGLVRTECSKGTYIRALLRDMGERLGVPAVMTYLVRLQSGAFSLDTAHTLEELEGDWQSCVLPSDVGIRHLKRWDGTLKEGRALSMGQPVAVTWKETADIAAVYIDGRFTGIARYDARHNQLRPHKMIYTIG